jgi:molecular chaperone GrpE
MSEERGERAVGLDLRETPPGEVEIEIVSINDEPVAADEGGAAAAPPAPAADAAALAAQLAAAEERLLRLRAEFENSRKRMEREREERERRALGPVFVDLLPVVDNLERALAARGGADDLRKGVELVARQLVEVLRRYGLAEIPAVGLPFDPRRHEAVAREESAAHAAPTVTAELQRGYWLNDRLLRPAMVRVAVPVEGGPPEPGAAEAAPEESAAAEGGGEQEAQAEERGEPA